ncbi:hypothetical protein BCR33DRAFT_717636 [Rhizoclosmatium globosum]|uniref:Uncharacterized protein n=1 Tax=Rhizoclosmatium globosum TaxID=329046 RepID=A0A1Y2C8R0_9FUNG|nr:hypothetical protein BCR33DRAFT_717636 [Rhizoclosmatium globosum]|eukprot:ORY43423.1 hypothetical protein BCR33DRAFT_717636 [Rhizoclosmatium globosum]
MMYNSNAVRDTKIVSMPFLATINSFLSASTEAPASWACLTSFMNAVNNNKSNPTTTTPATAVKIPLMDSKTGCSSVLFPILKKHSTMSGKDWQSMTGGITAVT